MDEQQMTYEEALRRFKRRFITKALQAEAGHMGNTALRIGVHRNSVARIALEAGLNSHHLRHMMQQGMRTGAVGLLQKSFAVTKGEKSL